MYRLLDPQHVTVGPKLALLTGLNGSRFSFGLVQYSLKKKVLVSDSGTMVWSGRNFFIILLNWPQNWQFEEMIYSFCRIIYKFVLKLDHNLHTFTNE